MSHTSRANEPLFKTLFGTTSAKAVMGREMFQLFGVEASGMFPGKFGSVPEFQPCWNDEDREGVGRIVGR